MNIELLHVLGVATIASSVAVLLVLALRKAMRNRFGAQAAYALWSVVPLAAAVALFPAPIADAPLPAVAATVTQVLLPLTEQVPASVGHFDPSTWLAALWLLGLLASVALLMRQQQTFLRALGQLAPDAGAILRAQTTAGCPALVGAWKPRIVVPADFDERFNPVERALIVAHEELHRSRGDAQINLFVAALRCLFWFNPLVHFAASRFRFDQELACDALVIARFPEARRPYADAMLKTQLAGDSWQEPGLPVGCYWQSSHPLKERISMLKQPLPGRARSTLGCGLAAVLTVCGGFTAWATQPANPAAIQNSVDGAIRADLVFSVDGALIDSSWHSRTHTAGFMHHDGVAAPSDWKLGLRAGEPFSVAIDRPGESWQLDGTALASSDATIELDSVLRHNDSVVGQPRLIVHDGEPAAIRIGEETAGGTFKGLAAQITLARADAPGTPAKAGTGPESGPVKTAPATDSGATYRSMKRIAYPPALAAAKVEGVVYVKIHVDADGNVASAMVDHVDPSSAAGLADVAVAGVRTWRFVPAQKAGKASASDEIVPVVFAMRSDTKVSGGTLDAIRVSPVVDPVSSSADRPPTEDVTFREMHPPQYPAQAVKDKLSGDLVFKVLVDEHGAPQSVDVEKSNPPEAARIFAQTSLEAIMQWHFNPGVKDGQPQAGYVLVPITFALDDAD
jgi:TonB family protein